MLLPLNYKIMYNITLQKYFYERIDKQKQVYKCKSYGEKTNVILLR